MKECIICGLEKPLSEFHKDKRLPDGHVARCKMCKANRRKEIELERSKPRDPVQLKMEHLLRVSVEKQSKGRDVMQYKCIQKHMKESSPTSDKAIRSVWRQFLDFLDEGVSQFRGYNPDELMDYQYKSDIDPDRRKRYEVFDQVQYFINNLDVCFNTAKTYGSLMKSTFTKNRSPFPQDVRIKVLDKAFPVEANLPVEEIKQAALRLPLMYRAILLCRWMSSMDYLQFDWWNKNGYEQLIKDLDTGKDVIRIDFPARMKLSRIGKVKKFHTYIGRDAIDVLNRYLSTRQKVTGDQYIFYTKMMRPPSKAAIDRNWRTAMRSLGFMAPAKKRDTAHGFMPMGVSNEATGKSLHELRDTFRTRWRKSRIPEQVLAEFFMGHIQSVDPLNYDKATRDLEWTQQIYEEVVPWLNIISEDDPETINRLREEVRSESEAEIQALIDAIKTQGERIAELERERGA